MPIWEPLPALPTREVVAAMYRAVLAGELSRSEASRATGAWWSRDDEWEEDEVLDDAVQGLGFLTERQSVGDTDVGWLFGDEQVAGWLRVLEAGRPYEAEDDG